MEKLRAGTTSGVFALEGMGGIGKTALAAEAVARLAEDIVAFPGGAAWITCEGLEGEAGLAEVWARVAQALSLEQITAQPDPNRRRAMLAAALARGQRLLLALDNIEPGLDADALLETLAVRNHTALLLTARQRVAPHRVAAIGLAPLLPDGSRTLFLERLTQAGGTAPTPAEEPALAALLLAVGGLPLALELTAAYAGVQRLNLTSVLRELESDGLNALAFRDPKRALLTRFERSWVALTGRQQCLFAGLSLLAGTSFPREAALAVGNAAAEKGNAEPPADLAALVSYALVEALPGGERLRLHPLLREYAAGKLKTLLPAQQGRLGDAMVAFWLAYAEAHPVYAGMDALEAEAAGLMGALAWAHEEARHREVLGLAKALTDTWDIRGRREDSYALHTWALQAATSLNDTREEQWAINELAILYDKTGQVKEARAGYERALKLAGRLGDLDAERKSLHGLASLDFDQGRLVEARAGCERALELARQLGNQAAERRELQALAVLDEQSGRLVEARIGCERALALARQLGDPAAEAAELRDLGTFLGRYGEKERGRKLLMEGLALFQRLKDVLGLGLCYQLLAWLDEDEGNRAGAIAHYQEALRHFEQVQSPEAKKVRASLRKLRAGE